MHTGFLTIYWRDMLRFVRFRALLFATLIQPALWLAFFGIAMSNNFDRLTATLPAIPGVRTVGYLTFIGAGIIAMTTLFTSLLGGTVLLFDKNWGLMRETLASPLPRNPYHSRNRAFKHGQVFYSVSCYHDFWTSAGSPIF